MVVNIKLRTIFSATHFCAAVAAFNWCNELLAAARVRPDSTTAAAPTTAAVAPTTAAAAVAPTTAAAGVRPDSTAAAAAAAPDGMGDIAEENVGENTGDGAERSVGSDVRNELGDPFERIRGRTGAAIAVGTYLPDAPEEAAEDAADGGEIA